MLDMNDFLGYMSHQEQIESVIKAGLEAINRGDDSFSVDVIDDFSDSELEYIRMRLEGEI